MRASLPLLAAAVALGTVACGGDDVDTVIVEDTGVLTALWSIDGSVDPGICDVFAVDAFELVVFDDFGGFVTDAFAPCESFAVSVELFPGFYDATGTLVDVGNRPVSVTEPIQDVRITSGSELVVEIDYPAGSIF